MSADGSITITWADDDYKFRTGLGEWREIQDKCGVGLIEILVRIQSGRWRVDDLREPIRVGLIGGGASPGRATELVRRYVDQRPLAESVPVALAVLMAAIVGVPEEVEKKERRGARKKTPGTAASITPSSTEPAPSSASHLNKSTA